MHDATIYLEVELGGKLFGDSELRLCVGYAVMHSMHGNRVGAWTRTILADERAAIEG